MTRKKTVYVFGIDAIFLLYIFNPWLVQPVDVKPMDTEGRLCVNAASQRSGMRAASRM